MQKQLFDKPRIDYRNVPLEDEFPISYFEYIQKYHEVKKLHYHNAFEIGLCLEGSGLFFINNRVETFQQGDVSFLFPNQPHIAQSPIETPSRWFFVTVDLREMFLKDDNLVCTLLLNQYLIDNIISEKMDEDLSLLIKMLIHELKEKQANYKEIIKNLLMIIMTKMLRFHKKENDLDKTSLEAFPLISPVLTYISIHYAEDISIKSMADVCHLSETYFRSVFKNAVGCTPFAYLTNVRMKMAKNLLCSTLLPIITISQNVGYTTISSFNRTFKTLFGISPSEFKKLS